MSNLRGLIGMPVVCGAKRVGHVAQAELDEDLRALKGLWISAGPRGTRFIPAERVALLGETAVLADDFGRRGRLKAAPLILRAVSTDGRRLGAVTDAELDPITLGVTALELSAGVWDDLRASRRRVTRFKADTRAGEVVIDPEMDEKEAVDHEGRHDEGPDYRHGAGRCCSDDLWRDELADRAAVEPEGPGDGQLDR